MAKSFTRGGYSFRPGRYRDGAGAPEFWDVLRIGSRNFPYATIIPASDGVSYVVSGSGWHYDARPSLKEACDLVMARLPMEGA